MEADAEKPRGPGFKMSDGDWTCEEEGCGNINYARRAECNRCKAIKPLTKSKGGIEIGKHLAEKSKGLFSAEDWQCATCGNVNWARRGDCNICHAPKFGKIEERTGAGGGFNERGTVEYKEKVESDGEYDDFGRRRKKKKSGASAIDSAEPLIGDAVDPLAPPLQEESGDEEDMGRYALDDSEEEGESSSSDDEKEEEKPKLKILQARKSLSRSPTRSKQESAALKNGDKSVSRSKSKSQSPSSRSRKSPTSSVKSRRSRTISRKSRSRSGSRNGSRSRSRKSPSSSRKSQSSRRSRSRSRNGSSSRRSPKLSRRNSSSSKRSGSRRPR